MALATQFEGVLPLHFKQNPPFSVEVTDAPTIPGETKPWRHFKAKDGLLKKPVPDVSTIYELFTRSAREYKDKPAVGSRKLIKTHKEVKKVPKVVDGVTTEVDKEWTYFELSTYSYLTYGEYEARCLNIGAGLRKLGLQPGDKLHIFAATSANWLCMSHACASQSITIVTAYDSLGPSGVEHSLLQSNADAMYVDPHLIKTASGPLKKAASVKFVIYNDSTTQPIPDADLEKFKADNSGLKVLSFSELCDLGEENPTPPVPPKPEDIYCIMYTSGSSGTPKGCPMSHAGIVAGVAGLHSVVAETVSHREYCLAYLPLAHIFELCLENIVIFIGGTNGYGSPRTLSDSSMRNCAGDMREFKPTVMVGVPQIWETVRKGVVGRVESSGAVTKNLFWGAYNLKSMLVKYNLPGQSMFDSIVFGKVRAMTGGRLRFIFNGASGISQGTHHFMSMVVAPMISGYGLTETCANGALGTALQWTPTAIGPPPPSIEVKLVSVPDIGYSTDSTPPQGELLLRGMPVLQYYYEDPEETKKAFTEDGWFKTGDIAEMDAVGHLKIIDRVKNLVKMQGGEYIALEKVEAIYRGSHNVQNIMIYGDGEHPRAIAVVSPNEKSLDELADSLGVDHKHKYTDEKVKAAVLKDLQAVGKKGGLTGLEIITGVVLVEEEWTPHSNLVTATQKLNRRALKEKYQKEMDECFKSS